MAGNVDEKLAGKKIDSTHAYMLIVMSRLSSLAHKLLMLMLMFALLVGIRL